MTFTLAGFYKSINVTTLTELTPVSDPILRADGNKLYVPSWNKLVGAYAVGDTVIEAEITTPSLEALSPLYIRPCDNNAEPAIPQAFYDRFENPKELVATEALRFLAALSAAATKDAYGLVWFGDGDLRVPAGEIITVKATSSTTLVAKNWTNGALSFVDELGAGRYAVVGMRAESAGLIAARLVFSEISARPGVVGVDAGQDKDVSRFRLGRAGVFGEFEHTNPPTVDFLSISADTSETVWLDIIKIR